MRKSGDSLSHTEWMRAVNWPPGFESQIMKVWGGNSAAKSMAASRQREAAADAGLAYAGGTLQMPGTKAYPRPQMTGRGRGHVREVLRKMAARPGGLSAEELGAASGMSKEDASTRIAQYRSAMQASGKPDLVRAVIGHHARFFAELEHAKAWGTVREQRK